MIAVIFWIGVIDNVFGEVDDGCRAKEAGDFGIVLPSLGE
jgi:hypothetical protein